MANITFDGFSLQDDNFITENINYRSLPSRTVETEQIARRAGVRVLNSEYGSRSVKIKGSILADSATELQDKIDDLNRVVSRPSIGTLTIDNIRQGRALVTAHTIGDSMYNQSYAPFDIDLLMPDPFFYGNQQTCSMTVTSGVLSQEFSITISGSYATLPYISFTPPGTTGYTTTSGISIKHIPSQQVITWSGTATQLRLGYGQTLLFDYDTKITTLDSAPVFAEGSYSDWEPETLSFLVTFSGACQGGILDFSYQPRYL